MALPVRIHGFSKYRSVPCLYKGERYASKLEARTAQQLDVRIQGKELTHWERQVAFPLLVNGQKIGTFILDFVAYRMDGKIEYIESKGVDTPVWKLKKRLFEALYPEKKLLVIRSDMV